MDNYNGSRGDGYYTNNSNYGGSTRNTSNYAPSGGARRPQSGRKPYSGGTPGGTVASYKSRYANAAMNDSSIYMDDIGGGGPDDPDDGRKVIWRRIFLGLKIFAAVCLVGAIVAGIVLWGKYGNTITKAKDAADDILEKSKPDDFKNSEVSTFYDYQGAEIEGLASSNSYYLTIDQIPQLVQDTFIVSEDKDFYNHNGISYSGMIRAVFAILQNGGQLAQGGSTITQQLTRNIYLSFEKSFDRKFKEIFISLGLEEQYDKDQILEFYINNIYFQNGYYGIEAAAQGYFGKTVSELSASQIVFLCAIPNNPTLYNPKTNKDNTLKRRDRLLKQLYNDDKITETAYNQACVETVELVEIEESAAVSNSLSSYLYSCATKSLMEAFGFEFKYGFTNAQKTEEDEYNDEYNAQFKMYNTKLFNTGYKIYTSIDLSAQESLQNAVDTELMDYTETTDKGIYRFQGASVSIDNSTGRVVAIVGNRLQKGSSLNRAYQAYRQPGSAIKPILVYGPAFDMRDEEDKAIYYPDYQVVDEEITGMDELDPPKNANKSYYGEIDYRYAIVKSLNTIPWLLLKEITPKYGLSYLKKMNFDQITTDDSHLASALGGVSVGTSPVEMCAAYATIANEGTYRAPTCINKIEGESGDTIVSNRTATEPVYDINTSKELTDVMRGVLQEGGTASGFQITNMDCAAKTGTTSSKKDGWICGYTPYYTTVVWVGYDDNTPCDALSGATYPASIWKNYMTKVHDGLAKKEFDTTLVGLKFKKQEGAKKTVEEIYAEYGLDERYGDPYDENNPYFTDGVFNGIYIEEEPTAEPVPDWYVEDPNNPGSFVDPNTLITQKPEETLEPTKKADATKTSKPDATQSASSNPKTSKKPDSSGNPSVTVNPDVSATSAPDNVETVAPDDDDNNSIFPF